MALSPRPSGERLIPNSEPQCISDTTEKQWWWYQGMFSHRDKRLNTTHTLVVGSLLANIILLVLLYFSEAQRCLPNPKKPEDIRLYSPAQEAIVHHLVKFRGGIGQGVSPYQGPPSPRNNRLWEELYAFEHTQISYSQALLLPNKTLPLVPQNDASISPGYLIVLSVFHHLHCLDSIRKALYFFLDTKWNATHNPYVQMSERNAPEQTIESILRDWGGHEFAIAHLDHCIDALRQHEICAGDITPTVFQRSKDGQARAFATTVHMCRDFRKIQAWAREHWAGPFQGFGGGDAVGKCGWNDPWTCLGA